MHRGCILEVWRVGSAIMSKNKFAVTLCDCWEGRKVGSILDCIHNEAGEHENFICMWKLHLYILSFLGCFLKSKTNRETARFTFLLPLYVSNNKTAYLSSFILYFSVSVVRQPIKCKTAATLITAHKNSWVCAPVLMFTNLSDKNKYNLLIPPGGWGLVAFHQVKLNVKCV